MINKGELDLFPKPEPVPGRRHIGSLRPNPQVPTRLLVEVHRKDVKVRVQVKTAKRIQRRIRERGAIKGFSMEASRRLQFLIRNTADMFAKGGAFLTVTYPQEFPMDGRRCKAHIHALCTWLGRRKIAYVWVLEFQKRGAPHFHLLLSEHIPKEVISDKWAAITGLRDLKTGKNPITRIEALKNPDQVGAYMGKYLSKLEDDKGGEQKIVPEGFINVGRFWGASRCLSKTVLCFDADTYAQACAVLEPEIKRNQDARYAIAQEQGFAAESMSIEAGWEQRPRRKAWLERTARSCHGRARSYAVPWEWHGYGFVLLRGAVHFSVIMRAAFAVDAGRASWLPKAHIKAWKKWDGLPRKNPGWLGPDQRGQFLLDGTQAPEWRPDMGPEA